ncbi:MAG: hypothetical protein RhofKO_12560 [Rhodothermales bacterium]
MTPYTPIDCGFYDVLEANAVRRRTIEIVYINGDGEQHITDRIVDLQAREHGEFMILASGQEVRLDALVTVGGVARPGVAACSI